MGAKQKGLMLIAKKHAEEAMDIAHQFQAKLLRVVATRPYW
jgi:hypothetical protein